MRWLSFIIGAFLVLTVQSVLAPRFEIGGARPDWLLVYVVFFALYARRLYAVVGAWGVGAVADLMTVERPVLALSYALAAMLVVSVRLYLFRYSSITQAAVVFVAGLLIRGGWLAYRAFMYPATTVSMRMFMIEVAGAALYTALFAPPFYRILLKAPGLLGIPRRGYGGGMEEAGV